MSEPTTAAGRELDAGLRTLSVIAGRRILAIEAEARAEGAAEVARLREALRETIDWITSNDDALGHGYCATQSGEIEDPCTCGYEDKLERWFAALDAAPEPAPAPLDVASVLQAVWDEGDKLDSNATRWTAHVLAERYGVEIDHHNRFSEPARLATDTPGEGEPAPAPLDVERLAEALRTVEMMPITLGPEKDGSMAEFEWQAEAVAAEYARLATDAPNATSSREVG